MAFLANNGSSNCLDFWIYHETRPESRCCAIDIHFSNSSLATTLLVTFRLLVCCCLGQLLRTWHLIIATDNTTPCQAMQHELICLSRFGLNAPVPKFTKPFMDQLERCLMVLRPSYITVLCCATTVATVLAGSSLNWCAGLSDIRGAGGRGQLVLQQVQAPCAGQQETGPMDHTRSPCSASQEVLLHQATKGQA